MCTVQNIDGCRGHSELANGCVFIESVKVDFRSFGLRKRQWLDL